MILLILVVSACTGNGSNENANGSSQATTDPPSDQPALGVEVIGDCLVEGAFPDATTCISLSITCEELPATEVDLRITPNNPSVAFAGTIILGSGGSGQSYLSGEAPLPGLPSLEIIRQLSGAGYKVVERKWKAGWFGEGSEGMGIIDPSCRHAELLRWLKSEETTNAPFCAFGNSGGSSEIAYGLTRWNTEEILDAAFLGAGPPMASLATGCLGYDYEPEWEQTCTEVWNDTQTQCGNQPPVCTLYEREEATGPMEIDAAFAIADLESLCTNSNTTLTQVFLENSVLYPGADLDYPNTGVHFLFGRPDCTESATLGTRYLQAITSEKSVTYIEGVSHEIHATVAGADAIIGAVTEKCAG
jgi:hypothetical protein